MPGSKVCGRGFNPGSLPTRNGHLLQDLHFIWKKPRMKKYSFTSLLIVYTVPVLPFQSAQILVDRIGGETHPDSSLGAAWPLCTLHSPLAFSIVAFPFAK